MSEAEYKEVKIEVLEFESEDILTDSCSGICETKLEPCTTFIFR